MAYAWAGPMGLVSEITTSSVKPLSGRLGRPSRRSFEAPAYSNGPPHSSSAPATQTSNRSASSPQRSRPTDQSTSSLWGWAVSSLTRSSLLPRALTLTSSPSVAAQTTQTPAAAESSLDGLGTEQTDAAKEPKPLLHNFLAGSDKVEVSYAALLADLSDLAYDISLLKADELADRHNLHLVSTSNSEKEGPITREAWYAQLKEQRRSMSPDPRPAAQHAADAHQHTAAHAPALSDAAAAVAHALLSGEVEHADVPQHEAGVLAPSVSLVAISSLEESSPRTSFSGPGDPTIQIPIVTFMPSPPSTPRGSSPKQASAFDKLVADTPNISTSPPVVPHTTAHMPVELMSSQAGALTTPTEPPAAWFACDDPITKIRYLVIQGSTSLEHWQINLQFEPVIFEDPALGVRVHRGVYMAALQLYDDLVPLVRQHLATSSFASITFTGHSLGGSLATVLMLLMVSRGVIPPDSVSPTYTFGAPAVFCGGAGAFSAPTRCQECNLDCPEAHHTAHSTTAGAPQCSRRPRGLFAQVGLGEEHIVNVIMHRDIVPRAFACDYMAVADLLVQWMPSFKSLATLQGPANSHKSLYSFLGRVAVLQPDVSCPFVNASDARHPHLPSAPGLYRLVAPAPRLRVHALHGSFDLPIPASGLPDSEDDDLYSLGLMDDSSMIASMATVSRPRPYTPAPVRYATVEEEEDDQHTHHTGGRGGSGGRSSGARAGTGAGRKDVGPPSTLKDAVLHFMNNPHPLTTLTEYAAYGPNGSISRYHNPRNYTLGLLALFGKAPHQQPPTPSSQTLPSLLLPTPGCTSAPRDASASPEGSPMHIREGSPAALGDGLGGWAVDEQMCAVPHELEMSPEARRLIRQPGTPSPARGRSAGRAQRAPSAGRRPTGAHGEKQQQQSRKPATVASRLPMLPGLGSLPASLGSLLGYKSSSNDN